MPPERQSSSSQVPLLIQGLIGELPPRGKPFPQAARERWLTALKVNLDLIYGDDQEDGQAGE
jgi:hypothetical protein